MAAVDPEPGDPLDRALRVVEAGCRVGVGAKIGWPFILEYGVDGVRRARRRCGDGLLVADLKLADISWTMELIVSRLEGVVDKFIAHAFTGVEGALAGLASKLGRERIVLVVSMSHPGAAETFDECLETLLVVSEAISPWGVVAPATRPGVVSRVREKLPGVAILSPGVGAQGARPGDALCAGADVEIVGRRIYRSVDPYAELVDIRKEAEVRGCL